MGGHSGMFCLVDRTRTRYVIVINAESCNHSLQRDFISSASSFLIWCGTSERWSGHRQRCFINIMRWCRLFTPLCAGGRGERGGLRARALDVLSHPRLGTSTPRGETFVDHSGGPPATCVIMSVHLVVNNNARRREANREGAA